MSNGPQWWQILGWDRDPSSSRASRIVPAAMRCLARLLDGTRCSRAGKTKCGGRCTQHRIARDA